MWNTPPASQRGDSATVYLRRSLDRLQRGLQPFAPPLQVAVLLDALGLSTSSKTLFKDLDLSKAVETLILEITNRETPQEKTIYLIPREEFDSSLTCIENGIAIYNAERVIEIFIKRGMTKGEALDYFYFNCEGAYVGPYTPRYE